MARDRSPYTASVPVKEGVVAATGRAEALTQAVLAKAFRGGLVPTEAELARREGREYEPASVLLERIRRERAAPRPPMLGEQLKGARGKAVAGGRAGRRARARQGSAQAGLELEDEV